ncbi:MAG: DUF1638 domain-containing protein [Pseudomonadota bacterium]
MAPTPPIPARTPRLVIACRVMEPELAALSAGIPDLGIVYLDQSLHRTPQDMAPLIQARIDQAGGSVAQVVLGYGLCSNGIAGVRARTAEIIVPKAHDCIALFMGSLTRYAELSSENPGTYYLTPGWVAEGKDPLGIMEDEYTQRVGRENAEWVMREELKHYTLVTLIDTGALPMGALRARAQANAEFFGMQFQELTGEPEYFRQLLHGPYPAEHFFRVAPGQEIQPGLAAAPA